MKEHRKIGFAPLAALVALIAFGGAGCESSPAGRAAVEPTASVPQIVRQFGGPDLMKLSPADLPGMRFAAVANVELPGVLETSGQITFDDRRVSTIVSRVTGRIEDTRVSQWDTVRRGEPIVALYSPDFMTAEAEYLQALSTSRLSTAPGMTDAGGLASAMAAAAKRKLELLGMEDADINAVKAPSPTLWMRAPISGTVVEKKALRGAQVNPGDELYVLGTLDDVWIIADIYEDDLARVHEGQKLAAVTTAFPDQVFEGVIAKLSPNIDPNTHTAQIRCQVRNPGYKLKPQMLARVKIITRPGAALVVPQTALVFETDGYYAFVQAGPDRVERRRVAIGSWNEQGFARVTAGLEAGENVVASETIQVNALWHEAHGEAS
ncbi:MAG: efflux RND transporter periplasmic adaptor subunit [Candidatus Binataceae bacterium]